MGIKIADLLVKIGADTSGVDAGLNKTAAALEKSGLNMMKTGGLLTAAVTTPIVLLGKGMYEAARDAEQAKVAFTSMLGSGEKAIKFLTELREFAAETPFEFTELQDASRRMLAFGFAAEEVLPMMTAVGDATSGLGLGAEGINRVVLALGQMKAKAKASGQEMMQLTEAGIPAWQYLADAMGLTTGEVMKLVENGLIPADQAIDAILAGMGSNFGGMMAAQMETAGGKASNLADSLETLKVSLGDVFLPIVGEAVEGLTDLVEEFNETDAATKTLIVAAGGLVAAVGPVMTMAGGFLTLAGKIEITLTGISNGFAAWKAGMSLTTSLGAAGLTPMAITLGSIGLAVSAIVGVWAAWNKQIVKTNEEGKELVSSGWKGFFGGLVAEGKSAIQILEEYEAAQARVNKEVTFNWGNLKFGKEALSSSLGEIAKLFIKNKEELASDTTGLNEALAQSSLSYDEYVDAVFAASEILPIMSQAEWDVYHPASLVTDELTEQGGAMTALETSAMSSKTALEGLIAQYDVLDTKMQQWVTGTAGQVENALRQKLPESSAILYDALAVVDQVMGTSLLKEQQQADAVNALVDAFSKTEDIETFEAGLSALKESGLKDLEEGLKDTVAQAETLYAGLLALPEEIKMAINLDTTSIPGWLKAMLGQAYGGGGGEGISVVPKMEALGGPVWANQPYLVGERGPEWFVPQGNGQILSNSNSQKGVRLNNYGTIYVGNENAFGQEILAALI